MTWTNTRPMPQAESEFSHPPIFRSLEKTRGFRSLRLDQSARASQHVKSLVVNDRLREKVGDIGLGRHVRRQYLLVTYVVADLEVARSDVPVAEGRHGVVGSDVRRGVARADGSDEARLTATGGCSRPLLSD